MSNSPHPPNPATEPAAIGGPAAFMVRPYSAAELCSIYGVTRRTWVKWLEPYNHLIGKKCGRYYTVLQVEIIMQHLGFPHWLE